MSPQADEYQLSDQIQSVRTIRTLPREQALSPEAEPMPWLHVLGYVLAGSLIAVLLAYVGVNVYDRYLQAEPELTPIQIRQQAVTVEYTELLKNTDAYVGTLIKINGTVSNVEKSESGALALNVGKPPKTLADALSSAFTVILVNVGPDVPGAAEVGKGTTTRIYGRVLGREKYLTDMGLEFTWPLIEAALVE